MARATLVLRRGALTLGAGDEDGGRLTKERARIKITHLATRETRATAWVGGGGAGERLGTEDPNIPRGRRCGRDTRIRTHTPLDVNMTHRGRRRSKIAGLDSRTVERTKIDKGGPGEQAPEDKDKPH